MRRTDPLRLALSGLLLILMQLAFYVLLPGWRATVDLYPLFLFLATASTGPIIGGTMAIGGGMLMDIYSVEYPAFHCLFYLLPVVFGSQLRAHMLTEFRLLGAVSATAMIFAKIVAQLLFALVISQLATPALLGRINYWPLTIVFGAVYLGWPWLVSQFPMPSEVKGLGH